LFANQPSTSSGLRAISEIEHTTTGGKTKLQVRGYAEKAESTASVGSLARVTCVEERKEWENVNLKTNFESKPLAGLGRGRLARAHACGRASTSGCDGDGSMVSEAKAKPMS
jgi:hypothetical protein